MSVNPAKAIILDPKDNAATALTHLNAGSNFSFAESDYVILQEEIQFGHKFALTFIPKGQPVVKYGVPIGLALSDIRPGEHIHLHNLRSMPQLQGVTDFEGLSEAGWKNRNT